MAKKLFAVALILLLAISGAGMAQTMISESQYVYEENGTPIGISKDVFYKTETGYICGSDFTIMTHFLGRILTMEYSIAVELDDSYVVTSASMEQNLYGASTVFDMSVDYESPEPLVSITITEQDGQRTEIHVLEPGQKLYFPDAALYMIVAQDGLVSGSEYEFLFLESSEFTLAPGWFAIGEYGTHTIGDYQFEGYHIQYGQDYTIVDLYADKAGTIHFSTSPDQPTLIARRLSDEELPELTGYPVELITREANLYTAYPFRSVRSRISLSLPDLGAVQLEDNRQRIVEHRAIGGREQVLVEITKDSRSHQGQYELPIVVPELEVYLGSDRYIDPGLPEIQALAADILQGETDAWTSVAKLVKWVFRYLNPAPTIIPKTTAQILANPDGNCKEYAVLFASLARSAGIPTRLALGLRYFDGVWIGHMWNEVWLGEWIAVDPSHGQIAPDALLLKLFHLDSATGLLGKGPFMLSDVDIAIRLIDSLSKLPKTPLETGVSGQTFANAEYAFSITVPDQWSITEMDDYSFMALADTQLANIVAQLFNTVPGLDITRLMYQQLEEMMMEMPGFTFYPPEETAFRIIDGYEALAASLGIDFEGVLIYVELVILTIDDMGYMLALTVPAMFYEHYQPAFEQVLDSIHIHW